jgi:hypothetical protein
LTLLFRVWQITWNFDSSYKTNAAFHYSNNNTFAVLGWSEPEKKWSLGGVVLLLDNLHLCERPKSLCRQKRLNKLFAESRGVGVFIPYIGSLRYLPMIIVKFSIHIAVWPSRKIYYEIPGRSA